MRTDALPKLLNTLLTSADQRIVMLRFLAVGGFFSLLYTALSSVFAIYAGLAPQIASATAYLLCIPPAYLSQRALAFRSDAPHRRAFPRYVALQAPLLALGAVLAWLLVGQWGWPEIASFLLISVTVAGVSFVAQRLWTFAHR